MTYCLQDIEGINTKAAELGKKCWNLLFSVVDILLMTAQNAIMQGIFWRNRIRYFRCAEIFSINCNWCIPLISEKYKKWDIFEILVIITLEVNIITRQMAPFFSTTLWALSLGVFHFSITVHSKFIFYGIPPLHYVLVCNIHIHTPKKALSILLTFQPCF